MRKKAARKLGKIGDMLTVSAWGGDQGSMRPYSCDGHCMAAVILADPGCVPPDKGSLDQQFTLRELVQAAARIAAIAQRTALDLTAAGRPPSLPIRKFASRKKQRTEASEIIAREIAASGNEEGDRMSPLYAAAFLALMFSQEVVTEDEVVQSLEEYTKMLNDKNWFC